MIRVAVCILAAQLMCAATFNKDVAPIIFHQCAPCHRPGESAPFSLLNFDDVIKHARQIVTVTKSRYMPPWMPEPGVGKFADVRRLTDEQIKLIEHWVEQGEAQGRPQDLPPLPKFTEGWQLGEPDLILTIPKSYTLQPAGRDVYRNFIFRFPLKDTRYVRALEIRPGNKRVIHHANLLIDRNRSSRWRDGRDGQPGFAGMDLKIEANLSDPDSHFLFWKPGSVLAEEPDGMAWTIKPGTDLVLNVHLQPSGKSESIQPTLGLYFTKTAPRLKPMLVQLENDRALDIPAHAKDFVVTDEFTLPVDVDLLGVYPHAHYLGRQIDGLAKFPNGRTEPLIRIMHWDLNWQAVYRYQEPVILPKGTTISMRWVYDNPTDKRVVAGDQSTDEMSHLWLQVLPRGPGDQRMEIQEALARKHVRRDPDDFTAHFNLGGVLQAKGDQDGAIKELSEAVRIRPRDEIALNTLAVFLQMQKKPDEAETLYRRAIESRPEYADAHYNLANLLLAHDSTDEAISHLREVLRLAPDDGKAGALLAEVLNARAHTLAGDGKLKEATVDFRELVALQPLDSDACTNLGVALAMQGELREAKQMFERAIQLNADNAIARKNLNKVQGLLK